MKLKTIGIKAHDQELALEPLTVLSAPNGSGKSTFAEAIRFLALGYVPSLGKRPQDTAALMRGPLMAAVMTLDDGRVLGRSLEALDKGYRAHAECSWLAGEGLHRHSREILSLFGRDEADVAEALDIRQLLGATPNQREARIASLLASGRAGAASAWDRLRAAPGVQPTPGLERILKEAGVEEALAWMSEERRRAAALHLQKSKALEDAEARVSQGPGADPELQRKLEEERSRLEREVGAMEAKTHQVRLREGQISRIRAELAAARIARDEATAERMRWEFRTRTLNDLPARLMVLEQELDGLGPTLDVRSAERELRDLEEERQRVEHSPWSEVARIAGELGETARSDPGTPMYQVLLRAQALASLARSQLSRDAQSLRSEIEERRRRVAEAREGEAARDRRRGELIARRDSLRKSLQNLRAEDQRTAQARDRTRLVFDTLERQLAELLAQGTDEILPEKDLHRKLHEVRRRLAALGEIQAGADEVARIRIDEARARADRDRCSTLERALQRIREEEIMETRAPLVELMTTMLGAAGRRETPTFFAGGGVCRIGWRAPGGREVPVQSMSGGEWILFCAALAATVVILRNAPLRILMVEAGEADAATLQGLLEGLRAVAHRLTCALVLTPRPVASPGWTVVRRFGPPVVQDA